MTFPGSCWNFLPESTSIPWDAYLCQMLLPHGTNHGVTALGMVSCSTVWDVVLRCRCSPTVLATQSLRASLTSTGPKLTFRLEERWKRQVITPLSYALLGDPKAVWFVLLQFVVALANLCFSFFLVSVSVMCVRTSVGTKCTTAVSLRLLESVFLLISSLPGSLQIATCLAIPQVYQTFPEMSHTQQWHNLSCFLGGS